MQFPVISSCIKRLKLLSAPKSSPKATRHSSVDRDLLISGAPKTYRTQQDLRRIALEAQARALRGDFHQAIAFFSELINHAGTSPDLFAWRGLCWHAVAGVVSPSVRDFERALELNSAHYLGRLGAAIVCQNPNRALADFNSLLQDFPNDKHALLARRLLIDECHFDYNPHGLAELVDAFPDYEAGLCALACHYARRGKPKENLLARIIANKVLESSPHNWMAQAVAAPELMKQNPTKRTIFFDQPLGALHLSLLARDPSLALQHIELRFSATVSRR